MHFHTPITEDEFSRAFDWVDNGRPQRSVPVVVESDFDIDLEHAWPAPDGTEWNLFYRESYVDQYGVLVASPRKGVDQVTTLHGGVMALDRELLVIAEGITFEEAEQLAADYPEFMALAQAGEERSRMRPRSLFASEAPRAQEQRPGVDVISEILVNELRVGTDIGELLYRAVYDAKKRLVPGVRLTASAPQSWGSTLLAGYELRAEAELAAGLRG